MTGGEPPPLLQLRNIVKRYPGVLALDDVDFELRRGEVHVLFGENGAGKSTLISIIAGAARPTGGEIFFGGELVRPMSVYDARQLGVSAVFQEFSLVPQMTVEQNLFLGEEITRNGFINRRASQAAARGILNRFDFDVSPGQVVAVLTRAEQQMVEIAKAFRTDLSVLILDEPTASLNKHETDQLFRLVGQLKDQGVGIIYITHRMAEIRQIGDRVTVLRDGRFIATVPVAETSENALVQLMTGRVVGDFFPRIAHNPTQEVLQTHDVTTDDHQLRGASVTVNKGEIVGLAGLAGSGKSVLGQACFGACPVSSGRIIFNGDNVTNASPRQMLDRGCLYLPSDRRREGLMMMRPARENISIAALTEPPLFNGVNLNPGAEKTLALELAGRFRLTPMRIESAPEQFSGGNQQKLMLARSLTREFALVIFDEPTVGVDVGTRIAIYAFMKELCENGTAILLISSDLPEILNLSHRAYVFYRGAVQAELARERLTEENVLPHFFEKEAA